MDPISVPESAQTARPWCHLVNMGPPVGVSASDCGTAPMLVARESDVPGFGRANYAYYRPSPAEILLLTEGGFIEFAQ